MFKKMLQSKTRANVFLAQDPYFKNPSDEEPFQDIIKYWMHDKVFAEQRLAGVNPMTLMRVTTDRGKQIILDLKELCQCLLCCFRHVQNYLELKGNENSSSCTEKEKHLRENNKPYYSTNCNTI